MKAEPLKKAIYDEALALGIDTITLRFSGGNDEGFLDVEFDPEPSAVDKLSAITDTVRDWAWDVYPYSGAGEGNAYGDDVMYDLKNGRVETSYWFLDRHDENEGINPLQVIE